MEQQTNREAKMLSVIVPVYNTAQYLEACIGSILSSTYQNLEIICINDGSTDESEIVLNALAKKDARVKAVHVPNGGVSKARNIGLSMAQGEYVSFVDSDDWIEPDYYAALLGNTAPDRQLWICDYFLNEQGGQRTREIDIESGEFSRQQALSMLYSQKYYKGFLWNKIFLNSLIKRHDLQFDEAIGYCEDLLFVTRYMLHCEAVYYNTAPFYHFRIRSGSVTQSANYKNIRSGVTAYQNIVSLLEQNGVPEAVIEMAKSRIASLAVKTMSDMAAGGRYDAEAAKCAQKEILKYRKQYIAHYGKKYRFAVILAKIHPKLLYTAFEKTFR